MAFKAAEKAFQGTVREYLRYSKKECSSELNRRARNILMKAVRATPRADRSKVKAALEANGLAYKLIRKTGLKRKEIKAKAKRLISRRLASVGYIAAGWYKALQAFGGRGGKTKEGGLAAAGTGKKSTPSDLKAVFENKAAGAPHIGHQPLADAINEERADMLVYIARKLREGWGRRGR